MTNSLPPTDYGSPLLGVIFLALLIIAIVRSDRRWRAFLMILGWYILGCLIGAVAGYLVARNLTAFEVPFGFLMGVGAAISNIRSGNRKRRHLNTSSPK